VLLRGIPFVLVASLATAGPAAAGVDLLRLTAPAEGVVLEAGGAAEIAWEPGVDLAGFPEAHEWEAFLSVDDGRSFPFRVTPHLDLARRRVAFRVPDVPSDGVRILLRVGDEREERSQPVAGRWRIAPARLPGAAPLTERVRRTAARGEAARPGDLGVWSWVEEDPGGPGWLEHRASGPETRYRDAPPAGGHAWVALVERLEDRGRGPPAAIPRFAAATAADAGRALLPAPLLRSRPILVLVQRRNE
jgi:hypothetical protein